MKSCYGSNGPTSPDPTTVCVTEKIDITTGWVSEGEDGCLWYYVYKSDGLMDMNSTVFSLTGSITSGSCVYFGLFKDFTTISDVTISGSFHLDSTNN